MKITARTQAKIKAGLGESLISFLYARRTGSVRSARAYRELLMKELGRDFQNAIVAFGTSEKDGIRQVTSNIRNFMEP